MLLITCGASQLPKLEEASNSFAGLVTEMLDNPPPAANRLAAISEKMDEVWNTVATMARADIGQVAGLPDQVSYPRFRGASQT
jgi:hypothetical protein